MKLLRLSRNKKEEFMNMFCRLKLKKGVTIIFSSPVSVTHNTYFMHITYE